MRRRVGNAKEVREVRERKRRRSEKREKEEKFPRTNFKILSLSQFLMGFSGFL